MGQAKQRKAEINALKTRLNDTNSIVVMPLNDDSLYGPGRSPGDYIRQNSIQNAFITGTIFSTLTGGPVKVVLLITQRDMTEASARAVGETWWKMSENAGPKFFAWLPINDMKNLMVTGLASMGEGVQGQTLSALMDLAGVSDYFKAGMKKMVQDDPTYVQAFNAILPNISEKILA